MPSFVKRGDIWHVGVRVNGKYVYRTTGKRTKSEAIAHFSESFEKKSRAPAITLSGLLRIIETDRSKKPQTVDQFRYVFKSLIAFFSDRLISSLTQRDVDEYKWHRIEAGLKPDTVNGNMRKLRAALNVAKRHGYIETNPASKFGKLKVDESIHPIDDDQFSAFLEKCPPSWHPIFRMAYYFGLRRGELVSLRWVMVMPDRLILPASITKNGSERQLPMTDLMRDIIESSPRSCDFVFSHRGKAITKNHLTHVFREYADAAGLPKTVHLHTLRHSCATNMLQNGYSLATTAYILGHERLTTTNKYAHPNFAAAQKEILSRMPAKL